MAQYLSQEWWDIVKKNSTEADYLKQAKDLTMNLQQNITGLTGGIDKLVSVEINEGKVASVTIEDKPSPADFGAVDTSKFFFRACGEYETFAKLNKGEITPATALTTGVYKIDGNMMALMGKLGVLTVFNNLLAAVPTEY